MKNFNDLDRFDQMEELCKEAISQMLPTTNLRFSSKYAPFDAYIVEKDRVLLIEMKVRYATYPDYLLEAKKLNGLLAARKKINKDTGKEVFLFYLNFTPTGTYIWDLDKAVSGLKESTVSASRYTAKLSNTELKRCYYLPTSKADKKYKYIFNKDEILKSILNKEENI